MDEIRFRSTEDQIEDELAKRNEFFKFTVRSSIPCTKCGGYRRVISNLADRTAECEYCWMKRRFAELVGEMDS